MAASGKLIIAGPFSDGGDLQGMFIFRVDTPEEAKALAEQDPAVRAGRLVLEWHAWFAAKNIVVTPTRAASGPRIPDRAPPGKPRNRIAPRPGCRCAEVSMQRAILRISLSFFAACAGRRRRRPFPDSRRRRLPRDRPPGRRRPEPECAPSSIR